MRDRDSTMLARTADLDVSHITDFVLDSSTDDAAASPLSNCGVGRFGDTLDPMRSPFRFLSSLVVCLVRRTGGLSAGLSAELSAGLSVSLSVGLSAGLVAALSAGCGDDAAVTCEDDQRACGAACCGADEVCTAGTCSTCEPGMQICDEACSDPQTDPDNCGGCGVTCSGDQECRAGSCEIRCDVGLVEPTSDPWGMQWDGEQRPVATLDAAEATCAAIGGRLPTPTELYRVSATQSAAVGTATTTAALWSAAPANETQQTALQLDNGAVSVASILTTSLPYRCVCPGPQPAFFAGSRCHGPAGHECATIGATNIDTRDRPPISRGAAIWECAHEHAHLASVPAIAAAIEAGVVGPAAPIVTADQSYHPQSLAVTWDSTPWVASGNLSQVALPTNAPFRCAGPAFASGTHPATVADEFVAPGGLYKSDAHDRPPADWGPAHDACLAQGGHVVRAAELVELLQQGLPNGTNTYLSTSDQNGPIENAGYTAIALRWDATEPRFTYTASFRAKSTTAPYRCIYYPIDPAWQPPAECHGGCFEVPIAAGPARIILDADNRPAATFGAALLDCASKGGQLASERDYTEAIRNGLPNGPGTGPAVALFTSDIAQLHPTTVRWQATGDATFTDEAGYLPLLTAQHAYRCMWSNEQR